MTDDAKRALSTLIRSNIRTHGQHITLVSARVVPRFAYTIGLSPQVGSELVLAGACYYSAKEVHAILHRIGEALRAASSEAPDQVDLAELGEFKLRQIDPWWTPHLLLGAADYYDTPDLQALQIVPAEVRRTIDVPNLTQPPTSPTNRAWRWLVEPWTFGIAEESVATTNMAALRGEAVTEAARWDAREWELFAGPGPDVQPEDVRVVPLASLLAFDQTLEVVAALPIGAALWRQGAGSEWNEWTSA